MSVEPPSKKMKAIVKDPQHSKRLVLSLQLFNEQNNFTDLCFICARGYKVYAHKLLLCSVSAQMKQIFLELPDNTQTITIHLPDIEAHMLGLVFDFLYEGSVRVNQNEYSDFQDVMNMLGIVLTTPNSGNETRSATQQPPPPPIPPQQQPQIQHPPQLVYVPAPPNSQGQVQYMLAAQAPIAQGQILQGPVMSPVVQNTITQQPSSQPMIINQANGQMVQAGSTQVVTTQVQQNNLMQVLQQSNAQVVPMSNQIVAGNQIVGGNQMVQCSSQMVVQGAQQYNTQMQVGLQNQVGQSSYMPNQTVQQRPQYVMSSASSQPTTSSRPTQQFTKTQTVQRTGPRTQRGVMVRAKPTSQQTSQTNTVSGRGISSDDIISVLEGSGTDLESLTAKIIRERLEQKLNIDLSSQEERIEQVLRIFHEKEKSVSTNDVADSDQNVSVSDNNILISDEVSGDVSSARGQKNQRKKKSILFTNSDDEGDEDFHPKKEIKKTVRRKKK